MSDKVNDRILECEKRKTKGQRNQYDLLSRFASLNEVCDPSTRKSENHGREDQRRAHLESLKTSLAKKIAEERIRRLPVVAFPSDETLEKIKETTPNEVPNAVLDISPSLEALLDKHFGPCHQEDRKYSLNLQQIQKEPNVMEPKLPSEATVAKTKRLMRKYPATSCTNKHEAQSVLRKRLNNLHKLKGFYLKDKVCLKVEAEKEKRSLAAQKTTYIQSLSLKHNWDLAVLTKMGETLFDEYRKSKQALEKINEDLMQKDSEWMKRILALQSSKRARRKPKDVQSNTRPSDQTLKSFLLDDHDKVEKGEERENDEEEIHKVLQEVKAQKAATSEIKPEAGRNEEEGNTSTKPKDAENTLKSSELRSSKRRQSSQRRKSKHGGSAKRDSKMIKQGMSRKDKDPKTNISTEEVETIRYRPCDSVLPKTQFYPELTEIFKGWDETTKEAHQYSLILGNRLPPLDLQYVVTPKKVVFNNYVAGRTYKVTLQIMYTGNTQGSFKAHDVLTKPPEASALFKALSHLQWDLSVDPCMMQVAPPGIIRFATVTFRPVAFNDKLKGNVLFISRNLRENWKMFQVGLTCQYPAPQLRVSPTWISFEPMKMWSVDTKRKYLTITNMGIVPSTVLITRKVNNVDGEESDSSSEIREKSVFSIYCRIKHKALPNKGNLAALDRDPLDNAIGWENDDDSEEDAEFCPEFEEKEKDNVESAVVAQSIIGSLMVDAFSGMKIDGAYVFDVQGRTKVFISVVFKSCKAPFSGVIRDTWRIKFTADRGFEQTEDVHLVGEVEAAPLTAFPKILDFKVCLVENGTQQSSFQVYNDSRSSHQLIVKVPKCLADQVSVDETNPFILGKGKISVVVRLKLTGSFCVDASKYFDDKNHILDFPVFVQSRNESVTGPPLEIRVVALVSRSMGLSMSPLLVDLGRVNTYHTVHASFYLNNHSLGTHNFAFISLPKNVMIQPNYGYGTIAPGERMKLDILYSPIAEDVPEGGAKDKFFVVACTTVDRLAYYEPLHRELNAVKKEIKIPRLLLQGVLQEPTHDEEVEDYNHEGGDESVFAKSISLNKKTSLSSTVQKEGNGSNEVRFRKALEEEIEKLNFEVNMNNFEEILELYKRQSQTQDKDTKNKQVSLAVEPEEKENEAGNELPIIGSEPSEIYSVCENPDPVFAILAVRARVQDPLCELSAQKVFLTPTAVYSYSITSIYLKAINYQSKPSFVCEKFTTSEKRPKIRIKYEVFSDSSYLEIEPCYGRLAFGQEVKLNLILRPKLTETEITARAKEMKALHELIRLKKKWASRHEPQTSSSKFSSAEKTTSKRGSMKRGSMKRGSMKRGSMKRGSMKRGSVKRGSVKRGSVKRGSMKRGSVKRGSMKRGSMKRGSMKGSGKSADPAKGHIKSKERKPSVEPDFKVDPESMTVNPDDLFHAQIDLLKRKEDTIFNTKFYVLVETQRGKDVSTKRVEQLECVVTGLFVKPDVVIFTPDNLDQLMKFETTAVSRTRTQYFQIHNTSDRRILVKTSFLSNPEEFYIPLKIPLDQHMPNHFLKTGFWLDPEHSVTLPVVFAPKTERTISEYLEVRANRTVVPLKLVGRGVKPKYLITPEFVVGKMTSIKGKKSSVTIGIENKCEAELEFNFHKLYTKEGPITPLDQRVEVKAQRKSVDEDKEVQREKSNKRQSVKRQSVKRQSVKRKSMKRKSMKGSGGSKKSKESGGAQAKSPPARQTQEEKELLAKFDLNLYDDRISERTVNALKTQFVDVNEERQQYLFNSPGKVLIKPLGKVKLSVEFEPVRSKVELKEKDEFEEAADTTKKTDDVQSERPKEGRKSLKRKSMKRQSVKKGSIKRKSMKKGSIKRQSMKKGSIKRQSMKKMSVKKEGPSKPKAKIGKGGDASRESLYLKVPAEMFDHTYASKVRLMLGHGEKVLDWWFLGQVIDNPK